MKHNCGICGFFGDGAEKRIFRMLVQLQHRGQLSAGITTYQKDNNHLLNTYRGLGLANVAFKGYDLEKFNKIMERLSSNVGIGHIRYSTCGKDDLNYAQPFEREHGRRWKWFSICFNGNIANYSELKKELEESGYHMIRDNDTEVLQHLISKELKNEPNDLKKVFTNISNKLDGAYNIAFINAEGSVVAMRDPNGLHPLCYSEENGSVGFASESVALKSIGFSDSKELPPGSMLIIKDGKAIVEKYAEPKRKNCFFEWIYFAHPASKIENRLTYSARFNAGEELAKLEKEKLDDDCVVVPVPDSSKPAGTGFAETLGILLKEGLLRNRYVGRTFIESKSREERVKEKFSIAREVFDGKRVFLVDDSIVRGTTMKGIVKFIKNNSSPKEIHLRISCPPITHPCFYGIDMGSKNQFIAKNRCGIKAGKDIAEALGVESVIYQNMEGLEKAIGIEKKNLCTACITGDYPTEKGMELSKYAGEGRACEQK